MTTEIRSHSCDTGAVKPPSSFKTPHAHLKEGNQDTIEEGEEESDEEDESQVPVLLAQVLVDNIMPVLIKEHAFLQDLYENKNVSATLKLLRYNPQKRQKSL